ncbi:hypothetical protein [Paraliomyxa miuraensis]|uniref:hypothetical protein n=1 Tax=Paraliomyxa miuraensis TaxID=376150 RepID=UPI00225003FF|nr:hypothetical protein [Paraliomyxa miuraensis]MCX4243717.1 hypothetical protein [Paraliomyxa miuraensis]
MRSHKRALAVVSGLMLCAAAPVRVHAAEPGPEVGDPPVQHEVVPVPRVPADPARSGRRMLAAGGVLLGLGAVGRMAIGGFWAGPARLRPSEPFGQWSIPNIAFFTVFSNVLVVPGLVLTGFGSRRYGAWRVASGARPEDAARTDRRRKLGLGLLGSGLSLWVVSRAAALPVLRACQTNGCAYGFVESTFWLGLGLTTSGAVLSGLAAGERRATGRLAVTPTLGPSGRGLAVGGRF